MSEFRQHSTKYDGRLHYRYPVQIIDRSNERLVTYSAPGCAVESHRGPSMGKRRLLSFFWREKPYVLHVKWDIEWEPEFLYVDITTATSWDDKIVRYIDLDLDLILRCKAAAVHLDDEDEFAEHRARWNYPEELVKSCWAAVDEVRGLLERGTKPFCDSLYLWRPGEGLKV